MKATALVSRYGLSAVIAALLLTACNSSASTISPSASSALPVVANTFGSEPFEAKAAELLSLVEAEQFAAVDSALLQMTQAKTVTRGGSLMAPGVVRFMVTGQGRPEPREQFLVQLLPKLDKWVAASPNSAYAHAVRGEAYYDYAWVARGNRYIAKTSQEQLQGYQERLRMSANEWSKAIALDPNNPTALLGVIKLGRDIGAPESETAPYFDRAIQQYPHFFQAYQEKSVDLQPKWGGSERAALKFVRESAASAPRGTAIPLIVPQMHKELSYQYPSRQEYYNRKEVWNDIETNYLRIITDFPQAGWYPLWYAEAAKEAGKDNIAAQYFEMARTREPNNPEIADRIQQSQ